MKSYISKTEGVCGGRARIRETRMPVWSIVQMVHQGHTNGSIARNYPNIYSEDVVEAIKYYCDHKAEIDKDIADNEQI